MGLTPERDSAQSAAGSYVKKIYKQNIFFMYCSSARPSLSGFMASLLTVLSSQTWPVLYNSQPIIIIEHIEKRAQITQF